MQNVLFVLLDGMEDHPNPELGGKKPYEVAKMPFIRKKAPHLHWTTGRGYTQLFLNEFWTGHPPEVARAALEAEGLKLDMSGDRTAFRLSPAYIQDGTVHWAYGVSEEEETRFVTSMKKNLPLLDDMKPDIEFFVHGRSVITLDYREEIPQNTPQAPVDGPYVPIPGKLGEFISKVREETGGITVYPWGIGKVGKSFPPHGCIEKMVHISDSPTAMGIGAMIGHETHIVPDLDDRFPIAKEALKKGHVFLHMDEVDEYSHEKDHMKKIKVLEHIDSMMEEYFSDVENIVFFVDHGTSCITGQHILMDVPFRTNIESEFKEGEKVELATLVPRLLERLQ